MKPLIILTNDPSLTAWGWAVIQGNTILATGCIKTAPEQKKRRIRKGDDNTRRVSEIVQTLLHIITKYNVNYLLSELPHGSQNASAAVMIGMTIGIIQTIADCTNMPVEWYSEGDAKKCLLGRISASKNETIVAINHIYDVKFTGIKYKDEAVADAMAIYNVARLQSSTIKLWQS